MKNRKSNIELLRIISMFLIVLHHFSLYTPIEKSSGLNTLNLSIQVLSIGGKVGANIFFIIMGYFLIEKKPNIKAIIPVWRKVFLYSVSIYGILWYFGTFESNLDIVLRSFFPMLFVGYWFMSLYVVLFLFIPYLNKGLKALEKKEYDQLLMTGFIVLSVLTTLVGVIKVNIVTTNYLLWGIFLYTSGGYLKLYHPHKRWKISHINLFLVLIFAINFILIVSIDILTTNYPFWIGKELLLNNRPQSFFPYLSAMGLFVLFDKIELPFIRIINECAGTMIAVYLIHDNFLMRPVIWNFVGQFQSGRTLFTIVLGLLSSIIIITIFSLFEWIIQFITIRLRQIFNKNI